MYLQCGEDVAQSKTLNIRLDKILYQQIATTAKQQHIKNSQVVRDALQLYYKPLQQPDTDLIAILKDQIKDLQQERDRLQQIVTYYATPWYKRLFQRPQLKERN